MKGEFQMKKILSALSALTILFLYLSAPITAKATESCYTKEDAKLIFRHYSLTKQTTLYDRTQIIHRFINEGVCNLLFEKYDDPVFSTREFMTALDYNLALQFSVLCSYADIESSIIYKMDGNFPNYMNVIVIDDIPYYTDIHSGIYTDSIIEMDTIDNIQDDILNPVTVQTFTPDPVVKLNKNKAVISEDEAIDIISNADYIYYEGTAPLCYMAESDTVFGNDAWLVTIYENMGNHVVTWRQFYVTKDGKNIFEYNMHSNDYLRIK